MAAIFFMDGAGHFYEAPGRNIFYDRKGAEISQNQFQILAAEVADN